MDPADTDSPTSTSRSRCYALVVALAVAVALLGVPFLDRLLPAAPSPESGWAPIWGPIRGFFVYESTWWALAIILALEWLFPARRRQPLFSAGFLADLFYFLLQISVIAVVMSAYVGLWNRLFRTHLDFLVIDASVLPWIVLVMLSILLGDLVAWIHHWVRHKVPLFWRFHTIHHSQREMNLFTDGRVHPVEFVIASTIVVLPFFIMGAHLTGRAGEVPLLALVIAWYSRFYHANIRLDLRWLKYVLVTPQSHRIHHSAQPEHLDKNFGVLFCIWDRMFGTHCDGADYPETGVDDPGIPPPRSRTPWALAGSYLRELVYPFRPAPGAGNPGQGGPGVDGPGIMAEFGSSLRRPRTRGPSLRRPRGDPRCNRPPCPRRRS